MKEKSSAQKQNSNDVKIEGVKENNGEEKSKKSKKSKKTILFIILAVVILFAGCAGFYFFSSNSRYFTTDNAKVTAKMYHITPSMTGKLLEWSAEEGKCVEQDEILGRQEVLPYITSPITGTVVENDGVEGQMVTPATQLAVVADTDNLYIGVNIEETDIRKIQVGQIADVKIDAYPGKTFKGGVSEIDRTTQTYFSNPTSFSTSGTYTKVTQLIPVKVIIENKENLPLTFGMNATVTIHLKETANNITVNQNGEAAGRPDYVSSIEAAAEIAVTPDVSGRVKMIKAEIGQWVEKGEVLFTLDSTDLELQLKQAAANYNAALSAYNNSQKSYDSQANILPAQTAYNDAAADYTRLQSLYDAGAISKVELDAGKSKVDTTLAQLQTAQNSAKAALDAAQAQMESAGAALEIAQKKVADCLVKAPMSGEVASKEIALGDMASPQTTALTLIAAQNVIVRIYVTETAVSEVKTGTKAEIKVPAIDSVSEGTVVNIAPACDAKTGLFPVEILIDNSAGELKPGMMANVKLYLP